MLTRPVRIFPDPFRGSPHILVLSEVLDSDKKPAGTNHRASCARVMEKVKAEIPWFGMEQGKFHIEIKQYKLTLLSRVILTQELVMFILILNRK